MFEFRQFSIPRRNSHLSRDLSAFFSQSDFHSQARPVWIQDLEGSAQTSLRRHGTRKCLDGLTAQYPQQKVVGAQLRQLGHSQQRGREFSPQIFLRQLRTTAGHPGRPRHRNSVRAAALCSILKDSFWFHVFCRLPSTFQPDFHDRDSVVKLRFNYVGNTGMHFSALGIGRQDLSDRQADADRLQGFAKMQSVLYLCTNR